MKKILVSIGALVLLLTLVASVAVVSAAPPAAPAAAQAATTLEGPRWVLVSYADRNGKTAQALPNVESTAQFANGRVTGSGGCNNFTAAYTATGSKLTVGQAASTAMACAQAIMDQESTYLANLQAAAAYKIAGGALTIANAKGDTTLTLKATEPISLTNGAWLMTSYNNGKQAVVGAQEGSAVTAVFDSAGTLSGSAGCNNYHGSYKVDGSKIQIGQLATTMMMCEESIMAQEQAYLAAIQKAATWDINGTTLQLRSAQDELLAMYTHQAAAQPAASDAPTPAGDLTANPWRWVSWSNPVDNIKIDKPENYVVTFNKDGTLAVKADCNNAAGAYVAGARSASSIDITIGPTTMAACPPQSRGDQFLRLLDGAVFYSLKDGKLYLEVFADSGTLAFEPAGTPAAAAPARPALAGVLAEPDLKNTYVTILPSADHGPRTLALRLDPGGQAQLTTHLEQDGPVVQTGVWKEGGPDTVAVTLTEWSGIKMAKPVALTFKRDGTTLTAVAYDKALFGEAGLKLNQAADVARRVQTGLATFDLAAGFPLDPTFVSVNGGGPVDAGLLGQQGCQGYINLNPVATVHWTGAADMVRTFFYSDDDATLVVMTPKGELLCSASANGDLLSPVVDVSNPVTGTYRIWVGSTAKNQLVPGILVLTAKPNVNVDTFDLTRLVKRPVMPKVAPRPTPGVAAARVQQMIQDAGVSAPVFKPGSALTATVTAAGDIPLFQFPLTKTCAGLVSVQPSFVFTATAPVKQLRVTFEGDGDASLLVFGNDGKTAECNDDAEAGKNVNPVVDLANLPAGGYAVYVGRLSPAQPVQGKLTVTDATNAKPAVLAPKAK